MLFKNDNDKSKKCIDVIRYVILLLAVVEGAIMGCHAGVDYRSQIDPQQALILNEKVYLELHYSNGEVYRQGILTVYADSQHKYHVGSSDASNYPVIDKGNYVSWNGTKYLKQTFSVELSNGYIYSFAEAYDICFDKEINAIQLFLWREEPSALEKDVFYEVSE